MRLLRLSRNYVAPAIVAISCIAPARALTIGIADTSEYAQNFDSLSASGTSNAWSNGSTLEGWHLFDKDGGAITAYAAGTGSSSAGGFYSFGDSSDRALGGVGSGGSYFGGPASGAIAGWITVSFTNTSGSTLGGFATSWDGEQWRNGGNTTAQTMSFQYGFGSSFGTVLSWTSPGGAFDWTSPVATNSSAAVNGNTLGKVEGLGGTIQTEWAAGQTLWFRWVEVNDPSNDHGMAIDDFSFAALSGVSENVPEAVSWVWAATALLGCLALSRRIRPAA